MNAVIRKASKHDADQIGAVHYRAWIETYTGSLPEDYLAARSPEKSAASFRDTGCRDLVVSEINGQIVGFCGWGEFRDVASDDSMGEIQGIYVLNAYQRQHIGQRLIRYALEQLFRDHYQKAGLWVLASNENAIRFYEKMGFEYMGTAKKVKLGQTVTELLYIKNVEGIQ